MKKQLLLSLLALPFLMNAQWVSRGSGINENGRFFNGISVVDAETVWAVTFDGTTFTNPTNEWARTTDGGATWQTGSLPLNDPSLCTYTIFALDTMTAWAGVASQPNINKGAVYKTTDGGQSWVEQIYFPERSAGELYFWDENEGIVFEAARIGIPNNELRVWRTADGGENWEQMNIPTPLTSESVLSLTGNGMLDAQGNHIWIATIRGRVYHSADRGTTWEVVEVTTPDRALTNVAFADTLNGLAVSPISPNGFLLPNKVFRTSDGGMTWTEIPAPATPIAAVIEYVPGTEATYFFGNISQGQTEIAFTHNSGTTWKKTNSPGIWCMDFLSPTVGWAGGYVLDNGEKGMYRFTSSFAADHANVAHFAGTRTEGDKIGDKEKSRFFNPKGMAMDSIGNIYIADDYNNSIKKISPEGEVSYVIAPNGGTVPFSRPQDIVIDAEGNLIVSDPSNYLIKKITLGTGDPEVAVLAGSGSSILMDGPADQAGFLWPNSLGMDAAGNIYVGDLYAIRKISPSGEVTTLAGSSEPGFLDGNGLAARFNVVWGIDVDDAGQVYVADFANHSIRKVTPEGDVTTLAGTGFNGNNDGPGATASFHYPEDVALAMDGSVYVADGINSVIRKIAPDGFTSTLAGKNYTPYTVAAPGPEPINGDGAHATFSRLRGLLVKPDGDLLVTQWGADVVQEVQLGMPSAPLVVMEANIENPWRIGHVRHSEPHTFSGVVKNIADVEIKEVSLQVQIRLNGLPVFTKFTEPTEILPNEEILLSISNTFEPDETGDYEVQFRFLQDGKVFYEEFQEVIMTEETMDYGDGGRYLADTYANYFPAFQGGYGVSFRLAEADSLSAISLNFSSNDASLQLRFSVWTVEGNWATEQFYSSDMVPLDSLVPMGTYWSYRLPVPLFLEAGEYVFTVEENIVGSMSIGVDNDIVNDNNWAQNFSTGVWTRLQELLNYQDLLFMIRPVFGNPPVMTSTHEPLAEQLSIAVSPNPFANQLTVSLPADAKRPVVLELTSLDGKRLLAFSVLPGSSVTQEVGHLPSGVYLVKDLLGNGGALRVVKR